MLTFNLSTNHVTICGNFNTIMGTASSTYQIVGQRACMQLELQKLASWETFSLGQVFLCWQCGKFERWVLIGSQVSTSWINKMFTADSQITVQGKVFTLNIVYQCLQQLLICQRKMIKRQVRPWTWTVTTKWHNTVMDHIRLRTLISVQHPHVVFPFYLFIRYANVPL